MPSAVSRGQSSRPRTEVVTSISMSSNDESIPRLARVILLAFGIPILVIAVFKFFFFPCAKKDGTTVAPVWKIVGRRRNANVTPSESLDWFPTQVWNEFEKNELDAMTVACGIEEKDREKAIRMSMVALWCVQDSPEARPPMSAAVKMLDGGMEIMPPTKPFNYLYAIGMNALKPLGTSDGSSNSYWYKDATPIMAKYEIQIATSS
nr:leaf rust 10 disease-resistance locus receptor-like protein kinase-like 2.1 [Quercus suber]